MTKYVIGPDVAIRLAHDEAVIRDEHQILAPALLRSQLVSLLYQAVHRGEFTKKDAERRLNYVRGLRIRLLGDRVLQNVAWKVADQLPRSQPRDLGLRLFAWHRDQRAPPPPYFGEAGHLTVSSSLGPSSSKARDRPCRGSRDRPVTPSRDILFCRQRVRSGRGSARSTGLVGTQKRGSVVLEMQVLMRLTLRAARSPASERAASVRPSLAG